MRMIDADTFVVFDLDDTLYREDDYYTSGVIAISHIVKEIYGQDLEDRILTWKRDGVRDIIGMLCEELNLPQSVKEEFIWTYRLHKPNIELSAGVKEILDLIENQSAGIAVLTDGRSISQRLKIAALGLSTYPLYISAEWNSEKPELDRFRKIQEHHCSDRYVYVGDNPEKDFKAPNELGWGTIGILDRGINIHSQNISGLEQSCYPDVWISDIKELRKFLC